MEEKLVLIVEDNDINLRLVRDVLQYHGYRTLEARTAAEGIALAGAEQPNLVLMDIQLPDMDGIGALKLLRAAPATEGMVVVALTASVLQSDRERLSEAGFDGYIAKPIEVREFPDQVRRYCGG